MVDLLKNRVFIQNNNLSSDVTNDVTHISVGSYNILAQCLLDTYKTLYKNCDQKCLNWQIRWKNIKKDFEQLNCDIFCLQEVEIEHYSSDIEPTMRTLGYKGFLSPKSGGKHEGCAMFVKTDKFNCDLSTFETVPFHNNNFQALSLHHVGQIALLSLIKNPQTKICVANTHLSFNPDHGEIKLAQLSIFLSKIDAFSNANRVSNRSLDSYYFPIVICGDFNCEANSDIIKFIADGKFDFNKSLASEISGQNEQSCSGQESTVLLSMNELPPRLGISDQMVLEQPENNFTLGTGLFSHFLKLKSVYDYQVDEDNLRFATSNLESKSRSVDFIFFRSVNCLPRLELVSYLKLLTSEEFKLIGAIPNEFHGSDHIPIVAEFRLLV